MAGAARMLDTVNMNWRTSLLAQAGLLLALAGICSLISNRLAGPSRRLGWTERPAIAGEDSTKPAPVAEPDSPPPDPARFAPDPTQPIRVVSPTEAWVLFQAKAPFLDARRSGEYAEGHIAGAWSVSVWETSLEARITEFEAASKVESTTPLVLYCSGGDCEDSRLLAARLTPLGYRNLFLYEAGYPDWVHQGRPTAKGTQP